MRDQILLVSNGKSTAQAELPLVRSGMIVLTTFLAASLNSSKITNSKLKCHITVAEDT